MSLKREKLYNSGAGLPPSDILKFKEWLDSLISEIPEESLLSAQIEISTEEGYYNSHSPTVEVYYWRPSTSKEDEKDNLELEKYKLDQIKYFENKLKELKEKE